VCYVVQVCLEGYYVGEYVGEGSVEPCLVEFFGKGGGGVCKHNWRLLVQGEGVPCWLVTACEQCGKGGY